MEDDIDQRGIRREERSERTRPAREERPGHRAGQREYRRDGPEGRRMIPDREEAVKEYIRVFVDKFWISTSPDPFDERDTYDDASLARIAFDAVRRLNAKGHRVISRDQLVEMMAEVDRKPGNIQDQLDAIEPFGILLKVDRFYNVGDSWYVIDEQFVDWLGDLIERAQSPPWPNAYAETIAAHIGQAFLDDRDPSPLAGWFHAVCAPYAEIDLETATVTSGRPSESVPENLLVSEYLRDGSYADDFREYIIHAELSGEIEWENKRSLEQQLRNKFSTLLAFTLYDGASETFSVDEVRRSELGRPARRAESHSAGEAQQPADAGGDADTGAPETAPDGSGSLSPEEWQQKLGNSADYTELRTKVTEEFVAASIYRGVWD